MASTIRELDHLRIPLEEIVYATNNFADENIIGKGGLGNVYKGQLLRSQKLLNVSVRRFDGRQGNIEFLTEISMLSSLKYQHNYIISMIGFCEEKGEKIIINSYHAKGSLMMYLSDPASFTWIKRMKISLQIAKAILYIHGKEPWNNRCIIHRNINSLTILLDDDYQPKLSGFEYSIKVSLDRKEHIYLCDPLGTRGYMDPEILNKGGVNHKSDIYSFGVVLFEILCGRKANQDNSFLAPLAKFHYEQGTLQDIIHPDLWKQMDSKSFKCFSEVAYSCLETDWTQRPGMKQVLDTLVKALKHDHLEPEESLTDVKGALFNYKKDLEIKTATWEERLKMCIDSANELNYLHDELEVQKTLIHDNTNSGNSVLDDDNLGAKIDGYRNSIFHNGEYMDPEFLETYMLSKESDVFGFGVHMFEMLCGYEASKLLKTVGHKNEGMVSMVRRWFNEDSIKKHIADALKRENGGNNLILNKGPNEDSLNTFIKIACQCVLEERNQRPTMKVVIQELQKALTFQENHKGNLRMSFEDIKLATKKFSRDNVIGGGGFGKVFKGELAHRNAKEHYTIVAKKLDTRHGQGDKEFYTELQILYEYKHENIISLVGYSDETDEKIIVYEHASKGSLEKHLSDVSLTWSNRLKICIDFATGLDFLHGGVDGKQVVIHRDIKSSNILVFDDWKAKVGDFGLSLISTISGREKTNYTIDNICGTSGYVDPLYLKSGMLTMDSDIYSFGVVLFEILCGKAIHEIQRPASRSLLSFIKHNCEDRERDDWVFKAINEEIIPKSLTIFLNIIYRCLHDDRKRRPSSKIVLKHLIRALKFQGDTFRMSLDDIKLATQNFSVANEIERGSVGSIYKGEFDHEYGNTVVAKKFDISQGKKQFYNEFQTVLEYRHENVIGLVGYINEIDEKIIVYEHASKGSLDKYLNDASLTWTDRLKICIDIGTGLDFLHGGVDGKEAVIHRNIKCSNILLFDDWKAKVGGFGLSSEICNRPNCTIDSDIYSFGMVLFEILCGKALCKIRKRKSESLESFIKRNIEGGKRDAVVFKAVQNEITEMSLSTYLNIMYLCLDDDEEKRPSSKEVLAHLQKALEFQDDKPGACSIA